MDTAPIAGQDPLEAAFERHLRRPARDQADHWAQLLGRGLYRDFQRWARQLGPPPTLRRGSPAVLIVPGLLGSTLVTPREMVWFNPLAIARGQLPSLALSGTANCSATSVLPFIYLRLRWQLRHAGYRVSYWPYDWRQSPELLATQLATALGRQDNGPCHLVAHSYGGLVATRVAAADPDEDCVGRVVTLGTPFLGTWAAHRALHGDDALVRRLAWLDLQHTAQQLQTSPLGSWPSLRSLAVPAATEFSAESLLLPAPHRLGCLVAGSQPTPVGRKADGTYRLSRSGDGTVPLRSATAPARRGHAVFRVEGRHGSLPNARLVGQAVVSYLQSGVFPPTRHATDRPVKSARAQRAVPADWQQLPTAQRWRFLAEWVAPVAGSGPNLQPAPALRARVHCGHPREAAVDAVLVGVFRHVAPAGLVTVLDGTAAAREALASGRFLARLGEVHALPLREALPRLVLVGLGDFDELRPDAIETATAAALVWARNQAVRSLGLVLLGTRSGLSPSVALAAQRRGLAPPGRSLEVCWITRHPQRAAWLRARLGLAAATQARPVLRVPEAALPDYLLVRQEQDGKRTVLRATLLRSRTKAALPTGTRTLDARSQARILSCLTKGGQAGIESAGRALAALLPESVTTSLGEPAASPLVVVHDLAASRWPWETLCLGDANHRPALSGGLSRHLESPALDAARWQRVRPPVVPLPVLLVMNPTQDLSGAEDEGNQLRALWSADSRLALTVLSGHEATRARLLDAFRSGRFEWVHYAGHALFDELNPGDSGLLCARRDRLRGSDLAGLANPPRLLVANACESGRVRHARDTARRAAQSAGLAEAFLSAGITHYLGTWWPVADGPAANFAAAFHASVLAGGSCGAAVLAARQTVQRGGSSDWADYLHYGDPDSVLLPR